VAVNLNEYVNKRIEELTAFKSETLKSLKDTTKTVEELSLEEEKAILENKMKYYSASGALAELEGIKKVLD
jgi:cell shape-determining protein MreC